MHISCLLSTMHPQSGVEPVKTKANSTRHVPQYRRKTKSTAYTSLHKQFIYNKALIMYKIRNNLLPTILLPTYVTTQIFQPTPYSSQ